MTLLQAMERTDWSLKVTMVLRRDVWPTMMFMTGPRNPKPPKEICQVCDNEFCGSHFVVIEDAGSSDIHVEVGPRCASDIEQGLRR